MNPGITEGLSTEQLQSFDIDSIENMIKKFKETKELVEKDFDIDNRDSLSKEELKIFNKIQESGKIIEGLGELLQVVKEKSTFISKAKKRISDTIYEANEYRKKQIIEMAQELIKEGNIPDNDTIISILDKIQYIAIGDDDKEIGELINNLKTSNGQNPILQLKATNIIGDFTQLSGISVFNQAQELMINQIFGNNKGFNDKLLMGYNNEKGNFIISIDDFKNEIKTKQITDINSKALASYFQYLKNNGKLNIDNLQDENIFGKEKLIELGKYWKKNPNEALAKNLLEKEWLEEKANGTENPFLGIHVKQNSSFEIINDIIEFSTLFEDIDKNFNEIMGNIGANKTFINNDYNKPFNQKLEKSKEILKNNPSKLKEFNKKGKEVYNASCPIGNQEELLLFAVNEELNQELNGLKELLKGFKSKEGIDAYQYLSERLKSNNKCDPYELINLLNNNIVGPNGEHLTNKNLFDIKNQLASIKDTKSYSSLINKFSILLGINNKGKEISIYQIKDILLNKYGIDLSIYDTYKGESFIYEKINNNSNIPDNIKKELIDILIIYNNTKINVSTLRETDISDIKMMKKLTRETYQKMHDARTTIYSLKEMFIKEPKTFSIFKKIGIQKPDELSIILTDYKRYKEVKKLLINLEKKGGLNNIEKETLDIFISIEKYIKEVNDLQKESNYSLSRSINTFKGYGEKDISKTNKINNELKLAIPNNNYYKPTENHYLKTEGGYLLKGKNGKTIEGLIISEEEKKLTLGNPEATENLIQFYEFFKELNLESVWKYRKELMLSMGNRNINFVDNDSLSKPELIQFGNNLILSLNNLIENNKELNNKPKLLITNSLSGVQNELRKFSGANSILSDEKTHNNKGEDKFAATLRNFGIIGGAYFKINTFREQIKK